MTNEKRNWKVGDMFVPLPREEWGTDGYRVAWDPGMDDLVGQKMVVSRVFRRHVSAESNGYAWGFCQISPAKPILSLTIKSTPL